MNPPTPPPIEAPAPTPKQTIEGAGEAPPAQVGPTTPAAQRSTPKTRTPRRNGDRIALGILFLVVLLAGLAWKRHVDARIWDPIVMPERIARVPEEWSPDHLAARLYEAGKIRSVAAFLSAAGQVGLKQTAPGGYLLPEKAGPLDLAKIFSQPPDLAKVTFPEGWTARQMSLRLQAENFPAASAFFNLAYPPGQAVSPLEGHLFPDTYYLPVKEDAGALVGRLTARFNEVVAELPRALPTGAHGVPLTLAQVVTLASIVERETDTPEERPLIAGVLLNRIRRNMPLQCDATVQYAMERAAANGEPGYTGHKNRVLYRDLKIASPYNTYLNRGLPPGPICNPGEPSLLAAASPQSSDYLYYVMSPALGHHRFGKTQAEHEHNIALARAERPGGR